MPQIMDQLLQSEEPSIRLGVRTRLLGEDVASPPVQELLEQVRRSPRVQRLLSERGEDGTLPWHPYTKWYGAHWLLATLAEIGYPAGDAGLIPLREQIIAWLLAPRHLPQIVEGRARRCASQESYAAWALMRLGLADERVDELVHRLLLWQWPDGGWNCDRRPEAAKSSFWETLLPLRALSLHAGLTGSAESRAGAERAAEVFLRRRLFRRERDGAVMHEQFVELHYPCYWRYDILRGLAVMAEVGCIADERCAQALDLLESKRLPDGGFPAEKRLYRVTDKQFATGSSASRVSWGVTSKRQMNEWVTLEALSVLKEAGRLAP
jgi:hypothetical protein